MNKIRVNQGRIVPPNLRIAATFMLFLLMFVAMTNLSEIWAILSCIALSMLIPPLWSSYHVIEIDPEHEAIWNIVWIMGLQQKSRAPYAAPEKLYVNLLNSSERINSHGGQTHTIKSRAFTAFVKLANGDKHKLMSAKSEKALFQKLKPIAGKLGLTAEKNYS